MKNALIGMIKLFFCLLIIVYSERYFFDLLAWVGFNAAAFSGFIQELLILSLYILILVGVYYIYKGDIQGDFNRFKRNWFPNLLMSIVFFAVLTIIVWVIGYLCEVVAQSFKVNYLGISYLNIFNKKLDLDLMLFIIKEMIIIPFAKCIVIILGVNEIFDSKKAGIFFSGLLAAIIAGLSINGTFLHIFFNIIPYFTIYFGLAYIYRKNNSNIWFSLITIILYTIFAGLLIAKIT